MYDHLWTLVKLAPDYCGYLTTSLKCSHSGFRISVTERYSINCLLNWALTTYIIPCYHAVFGAHNYERKMCKLEETQAFILDQKRAYHCFECWNAENQSLPTIYLIKFKPRTALLLDVFQAKYRTKNLYLAHICGLFRTNTIMLYTTECSVPSSDFIYETFETSTLFELLFRVRTHFKICYYFGSQDAYRLDSKGKAM